MTELSPAPEPVEPSRRRRGLLIGAVVVLAVAAIPVAASLGGGDDTGGGGKGPLVVNGDAITSVRAAVGTTLAAGSYDMDFTLQSTPADQPAQGCTPIYRLPANAPTDSGGSASSAGGSNAVVCVARPLGSSNLQGSGHGTVNFDPFAMVITSNTSAASNVTVYVNTTTMWEGYAGGVSGYGATGVPLSRFASTVENALGQGQGAVAMLGLASQGGYLNLEQEAVATATAAGTGSVDGTPVAYYDVTLDLTKLVDAPNLTDEERTTMQDAIPLLAQGGYSGTTETIGIDSAGYIREVTATTKYADGSSSTRHTILSNFGCASKVYTPDQEAPPVTTTVPCAPAPSAAVTTTPTTTTTPVTTVAPTVPPTSTSEAPTTSTSEVQITEPPTSTSKP